MKAAASQRSIIGGGGHAGLLLAILGRAAA